MGIYEGRPDLKLFTAAALILGNCVYGAFEFQTAGSRGGSRGSRNCCHSDEYLFHGYIGEERSQIRGRLKSLPKDDDFEEIICLT